MQNINYIPEEDKIIREMAAAGKTIKEMAMVLTSRSQDALMMYCRRRGIELTVSKPEIDMQVFRKLMGGK